MDPSDELCHFLTTLLYNFHLWGLKSRNRWRQFSHGIKTDPSSNPEIWWAIKLRSVYSNTHCCCCCKSLQSCPTLCDPIDGSPPGSPVPGILQARTLEWVAITFSNAGKWKVKVKSFSCVRPSATPWTAAHQASPSLVFSRQEHWIGLPFPSTTNTH